MPTGWSVPPSEERAEGHETMLVIGIDAHKRSHTAVAVDKLGRQQSVKTVGTTTKDSLGLLKWAAKLDEQRLWAIEDCRHLSRRLERDLLAAGEKIVRVPPKLMANARDAARTYGKSDPIDALAVARAVLREPNLPTACLDGIEREVRLLVDHREDLVAERTPSSDGYAGTSMNWHQNGNLQRRSNVPAPSTASSSNSVAILELLPDWQAILSRTHALSLPRSTNLVPKSVR
jgi:hypothetical protein